MKKTIQKWFLKIQIKRAIAEIKRRKLPIEEGKEQVLVQAFENYKKQTIQQLEEIYEKHCKAVEEK